MGIVMANQGTMMKGYYVGGCENEKGEKDNANDDRVGVVVAGRHDEDRLRSRAGSGVVDIASVVHQS